MPASQENRDSPFSKPISRRDFFSFLGVSAASALCLSVPEFITAVHAQDSTPVPNPDQASPQEERKQRLTAIFEAERALYSEASPEKIGPVLQPFVEVMQSLFAQSVGSEFNINLKAWPDVTKQYEEKFASKTEDDMMDIVAAMAGRLAARYVPDMTPGELETLLDGMTRFSYTNCPGRAENIACSNPEKQLPSGVWVAHLFIGPKDLSMSLLQHESYHQLFDPLFGLELSHFTPASAELSASFQYYHGQASLGFHITYVRDTANDTYLPIIVPVPQLGEFQADLFGLLEWQTMMPDLDFWKLLSACSYLDINTPFDASDSKTSPVRFEQLIKNLRADQNLRKDLFLKWFAGGAGRFQVNETDGFPASLQLDKIGQTIVAGYAGPLDEEPSDVSFMVLMQLSEQDKARMVGLLGLQELLDAARVRMNALTPTKAVKVEIVDPSGKTVDHLKGDADLASIPMFKRTKSSELLTHGGDVESVPPELSQNPYCIRVTYVSG